MSLDPHLSDINTLIDPQVLPFCEFFDVTPPGAHFDSAAVQLVPVRLVFMKLSPIPYMCQVVNVAPEER